MKIRVLPKDKCIEIAKTYFSGKNDTPETDEGLLLYLPDRVFGAECTIKHFVGDFVVCDKGNENEYEWRIPPFFVEEIWD